MVSNDEYRLANTVMGIHACNDPVLKAVRLWVVLSRRDRSSILAADLPAKSDDVDGSGTGSHQT